MDLQDEPVRRIILALIRSAHGDVMTPRLPEPDYSAPQKWLHWTHAAFVLTLIPVGVIMTNLGEGPVTNALYEVHKSFGMLVFIFAVLRVATRIAKGVPPRDPTLPHWQHMAAEAVHKTLYVLIFVVPALGYTATVMCCKPVMLFWTVPMTLPINGSEATTKLVFQMHYAAAFLLAFLVAGHIAAALYHRFIRRDAILSRMMPRGEG